MLGHGGMGKVYRAWDPTLARDVAIKVLGASNPDLLRRFSREAEAVSRLNHPNVVGILDFSAAPLPFIVMEYLRGEDLSARIRRGTLATGEAVDILLGVCAGVHACHAQGIVHRDLKPANVFLHETPNGTMAKVLDFGVAILDDNPSGDITRPGHAVGTPRYFSPEQIRHVEADAKSDQYAMAVTAYTMLTGRSPFAGKDGAELVHAILNALYPRPRELRPELPADLESAILDGMQVRRDLRFPCVLDFGRVLWKHATPEGQTLWREPFGSPVEPACGDTTQHTVSTDENWGGLAGAPSPDPRTGDRPRMVVVPVSPLEEAPVVATTQRLQTATAIDKSFGVPRPLPARAVPALAAGARHAIAPHRKPTSVPAPTTPDPPWKRKLVLAVAAVCLVALTSLFTWLLIRTGAR